MPDAPVKLCECGCGQETSMLRKEDSTTGLKRGERAKFVQGHNRRGRFVPPEKIVKAYRSGLSYGETADAMGVSVSTVARRVRAAGAVRPPHLRRRPEGKGGRPKGDGPGRYKWLANQQILNLREQGFTYAEIAQRFGVSKGTVYVRLREAGAVNGGPAKIAWPSAAELKRLFLDEEMNGYQIGLLVGASQSCVWEKLKALGLERTAPQSLKTLGGLWRAFEGERRQPAPGLSCKQQDLLTVLQLAETPLSTQRLSELFSAISRGFSTGRTLQSRPKAQRPLGWVGWEPDGLRPALRRLEAKRLVQSVVDGDARMLWMLAVETNQGADAWRDVELRNLIAEQERENGSSLGHTGKFALDATIDHDADLTYKDLVTIEPNWWEEPPA